ncbi:MAG: zf-HC2 domain-containing protein [Sphaerochaetaceae bacterium]|nr:zf-HC2 domain-containing protein [Spirochaetales bacterium]MDY5499594.1 zf-HC2 domain-containing protein [Sphaerochaetaceae bacterium]
MCVDDELLSAYLDGELQEPWRTQVEQHLQYCSACRNRFEQLKALDAKLQSATLSDDEVKQRQDRVLAYFERSRFPQRRKESFFRKKVQVRLVPALLSSAAAFVVVFIGAFVLFGTNTKQTETLLPGIASPVDSSNVRQVSEVRPQSLDDYSVDQIVDYLEQKGYAVDLRLKAVEPIK